MSLFIAFAAILLFSIFTHIARIASACRSVIRYTISVSETLLRQELSDLEKERIARTASLILGKQLLEILARTVLAVLPPTFVILAAGHFGFSTFAEMESDLQSWPAILFAVAATLVAFRR